MSPRKLRVVRPSHSRHAVTRALLTLLVIVTFLLGVAAIIVGGISFAVDGASGRALIVILGGLFCFGVVVVLVDVFFPEEDAA